MSSNIADRENREELRTIKAIRVSIGITRGEI